MRERWRWRTAVLAIVLTVVASGCPGRFGTVGDSVTWSSRHEIDDVGGDDNSYPGLDIPRGRRNLRALLRDGQAVAVVTLGGIDLADEQPRRVLRRRIRAALGDPLDEFGCVIWLELNQNRSVHEHWPERTAAFNAILHEEAERAGVPVAPWARMAARHIDDGWFQWDGLHLRPEGRRQYAKFMSRWVRRVC